VKRSTSTNKKRVKAKEEENKIPKRYLLAVPTEDGSYEPMTENQFEQFKAENPALAKYFEVHSDEPDVNQIDQIPIPEEAYARPIYDQWEKAAMSLLRKLEYRDEDAEFFKFPVDVEGLRIPDYYTIVKKPMDFGTIRTKLKEG